MSKQKEFLCLKPQLLMCFLKHDLKTCVNRFEDHQLRENITKSHLESACIPLFLSLSPSLSPLSRGRSMPGDLEGALAVKVADPPATSGCHIFGPSNQSFLDQSDLNLPTRSLHYN